MEHFMHGGDWAGYFNEYGKPPMDFSASVSPLGLPESVQIAVSEALVLAGRYPDPFAVNCVRHSNGTTMCQKEYILCGNGAADLIYRLVLCIKAEAGCDNCPYFFGIQAGVRYVWLPGNRISSGKRVRLRSES